MRLVAEARVRVRRGLTAAVGALATLPIAVAPVGLTPAKASETITYSYDELGRLVKVGHGTAGPNANVVASYSYDPADNRCNVTVSLTGGASGGCTPAPTITLAPTTLPNGGVGSAYSQTITASGGTAPYTFAKTVGTLPAGLTLTTAGVLSGTPTTAATSSFTITATDSASNSGNRAYSVTIAASTTACSGVSFTIASNGAVTEGTNSVFTVTKAGTTSSSCSVNYATANGTAIAGTNYTAASGTLTFTSAQTSNTVSVATTNTSFSGSKTFSTALSAPSAGSAVATPGSATATINGSVAGSSACSGISFSVNDTAGYEGEFLSFTVLKAGTTSASCSVNYTTANSSAVAPGDYVAASGTLTFAAGETSKIIDISAKTDSLAESNETFFLNLSGAANGATISDAQGIGTIYDQPPPEQCFDEGGRRIPCTGVTSQQGATAGTETTDGSATAPEAAGSDEPAVQPETDPPATSDPGATAPTDPSATPQ